MKNLRTGTAKFDTIRAKDASGLYIQDDGGNGLFIKDGGNVGIGTTNPSAKLHVGSAKVSDYDYLAIFDSTSSAKLRIGDESNAAQNRVILSNNYNRNSTGYTADDDTYGVAHLLFGDGQIKFATAAAGNNVPTDRVTVDSNGNVGIGTTSPDKPLEIAQSDGTSGIRLNYIPSTYPNNYLADIYHDGANGLILESKLGSATIAGDILLAPNGGNVGIGTTNPDRLMHLASNAAIICIEDTAGATDDKRAQIQVDDGKFEINSRNDDNSNRTDNIFVADLGTGNVGIGTTNPVSVHNRDSVLVVGGGTGMETSGITLGMGSGYSNGPYEILTSSEGSHASLRISDGTDARLTIRSNGNVGIGTTSPEQRLFLKDGHFGIDGSGYIIQRGTSNTTGEYGVIHRTGYYQKNTGNHYGKVRINSTYDSSSNAASLKFYTATGGANSSRYVFGLDSDGTAKCVYDLEVSGNVTKSSGNFKIDHPLPEKSETHHLVHSFIEAPQADNIYRGKVELVAGKAEVNIDAVSGMTEGTFVALNRDIQVFTSNESDWDAVRGKVEGNTVIIECQNTESTATVSWLVIGERQDEHMLKSKTTDENGKLIVEPLKPESEPVYEEIEPEEVITEEPVTEEASVSIGESSL
jgi:hypothetical protein